MEFRWNKNGVAINAEGGVSLTRVDEFSTMLTFASLAASDSASYACVATNEAGFDSYTTRLIVKGIKNTRDFFHFCP